MTLVITHDTVNRAWTEGVDYQVDDSGCWLWLGYMDKNGYGRFYNRAARAVQWAHRFSYERFVGPLAPKHEVDHECQVTRCVNPAHLAQVTRAEHAARTMRRLGKDDMHARAAALRALKLTYAEIAAALGLAGRESAHQQVRAAIRKGLVDPDCVPSVVRLTAEERADICEMYGAGIPQTAIGQFYGIASSQISRVCSGMTSGHARRDSSGDA